MSQPVQYLLPPCCAVACLTFSLYDLHAAQKSAVVNQHRNAAHYVQADVTRTQWKDGHFWLTDARGELRQLTFEPRLQKAALRQLAQGHPSAGALVAIDYATGNIVAMAEWPRPASAQQSLYTQLQPAASLFKLITSAALIETARVAPERVVCTSGGMHQVRQENLTRPTTGAAECGPFVDALAYSRNAAFAQLAHAHLNAEDLENYADRFGFGGPLPLEIQLPLGSFETDVEPLGFARAATGFVGSKLSPLGAAYLAYVVASNGSARRLHILADTAMDDTQGHPSDFSAVSTETAQQLKHMMELSVRKGTSYRAFHDEHGRPYLDRVSVAGKTGTLGESDTTVSWFTGFAPSQNPRIVVSVVLRNGPVWHKKANQIAREWLGVYFAEPPHQQLMQRLARKTTNDVANRIAER